MNTTGVMRKPTTLGAAMLLTGALLLNGCGGSDDADGSTGGSTGGGAYCAATESWPASAATKEREILDLVNQFRAEGATCGSETFAPREPLEMLGSLQCAARVHSADMFEKDYFSHTAQDGSEPRERMEAAGYEGRSWAENIAAGSATADGAMDQWMNSEGHCANIMGNYRYIGVGYVEGGSRRHLWTQTFGN